MLSRPKKVLALCSLVHLPDCRARTLLLTIERTISREHAPLVQESIANPLEQTEASRKGTSPDDASQIE